MSKLQAGINDIDTVNPNLALEWDIELNYPVLSSTVSAHSNKKYWWKCKVGHSWLATPNNRSNGYGCPYCSGRKAIPGKTDFASRFPKMLSEWDYSQNTIDPKYISATSNKKVWWKCQLGHSWMEAPCRRVRGDSCPYCSNHRVIEGFNDLASSNPSLAEEWNYKRNGNLSPNQITASSSKTVWWICSKGHEWKTSVSHRNGEGTACPYCSGRYAITGETDIKTINPFVAAEWNYTKNCDLLPENTTAYSSKKVWWKCSICNNEWAATPASRSFGSGCPKCSKRNRTSFPEQAIFFYIKRFFPDAINSYTKLLLWQINLDKGNSLCYTYKHGND